MSAKPEEFTLNQFKNGLNDILRCMPGASLNLKFIDANYLEGKEIPHLRLEQEFDVSSEARWEAFIRDLRRCGIEAQLSRNPRTNQLRIIIKKNPGEAHFENNKKAITQMFAQYFRAPVLPLSSVQTSTPSMSSAQAIASSTPSSAMSSVQVSASSTPPSSPVQTTFSDVALASHKALVESLPAISALHSSAQQGNLKEVKRILEDGKEELRVQINASRFPGRYAIGAPDDTIFHTAVRSGDFKRLFSLLAYPRSGEDRTLVNKKNLFGETPVQLAIKTMDFNAAEIFYQCIKMQKESYSEEIISATDEEYLCLEAMHRFWHVIHQKDAKGNLPLHLAAENGQVDVVNYLLEPQTKPLIENGMVPNYDGNTPLHLAVRNGHIEIAKKLIGSNILVVNAKNKDGDTPLHLAVRNGHVEIVEYLKNAKVLVMKRIQDKPEIFAGYVEMAIRQAELAGNNGRAKNLRLAKNSNDLEKLIELLGYAVKINIENNEGDMPLHLAVKDNSLIMADRLIRLGADVKTKNNDGDTLLHLIVKNIKPEEIDNAIKIARKLISLALEIDEKNDDGDTPLHLAIVSRNFKMFKALRSSGADLNLRNAVGDTPLHVAIRNGSDDIAEYLIDRVDLTIINKEGLTALQLAIRVGNLKLIEILMSKRLALMAERLVRAEEERKNEYKSVDKKPDLFLHLAVRSQKKEVVDCIIFESEGSIDEGDLNGNTPLHLMVEMNDKEMVRYLIQKGANPNIKNQYGYTPLALAVNAGNLSMIRFLIEEIKLDMTMQDEQGNTVVWKDSRGNTLLALAIKTGNPDIINYFLENMPYLMDIPNKDGLTPFMAALKNNDVWLAEHLVYYGAHFSVNEKLDISRISRMSLTELEATARRNVSNTMLYKELQVYIAARDRLFDAFNQRNWEKFNHILSSHNPEHRIDLNIRNRDGDTLLHVAARAGNQELVQWLIKQGADSHIRNRHGETPFQPKPQVQPAHSPAFFQLPLPSSQQTQERMQVLTQVFAANPFLNECFRIECNGDEIRIRESAGYKQQLVHQSGNGSLYNEPLREGQFLYQLLNSAFPNGISWTTVSESRSVVNGSQPVTATCIMLSFPAPNLGQKPPAQFGC